MSISAVLFRIEQFLDEVCQIWRAKYAEMPAIARFSWRK
jgi:hypothetical protein